MPIATIGWTCAQHIFPGLSCCFVDSLNVMLPTNVMLWLHVASRDGSYQSPVANRIPQIANRKSGVLNEESEPRGASCHQGHLRRLASFSQPRMRGAATGAEDCPTIPNSSFHSFTFYLVWHSFSTPSDPTVLQWLALHIDYVSR